MGITFKEIRTLVRIKEKDNSAMKWSDYEIKISTNEAIRYLSNALALQNADFIETTKKYDQDEINKQRKEEGLEPIDFAIDGADLPNDYVSLIALSTIGEGELLENTNNEIKLKKDQFRVTGNKVYCGSAAFVMTYKKALPEVVNDESVVDIPFIYKDALVSIIRLLLANDTSGLQGAIDTLADRIVPRRRYRNAKIKLAWKV